MKTAAFLFIALALAVQANAAPVGTRASQFATLDVTVGQFGYNVNTLATYTNTTRGMAVQTSPNNLLPDAQTAGPLNGLPFSVFFVIPQEVIDFFY